MMNRVTAKVDRRNLKLTPTVDGSEAIATRDNAFKVMVVNESEQFASFQVKLSVPGIDSDKVAEWYKIEPEFGTKKPPGASTPFDISITRPPLPVYDQPIDLLLEVFSIEYPRLRTKQSLSLVVAEPSQPLTLVLPNSSIKAIPSDRVEVPVLLHNTSRNAIEVRQLVCTGIDVEWFEGKSAIQRLTVEPNYPARASFFVNIPLDLTFPLESFEFTVEAISNIKREIPMARGVLEVIPPGIVEFACSAKLQRIPSRAFSFFLSPPAAYLIELKNTSNTPQRIHLTSAYAEPLTLQLPDPFALNPAQQQSVTLFSKIKRPWWGWRKRHAFIVDAEVLDLKLDEPSARVRTVPLKQELELEVLPIISPWLLLVSGALLLGLLWLYWLLNPRSPHIAPVNAVRMDGNAGTVFSASSDRQILRWGVNNAPFQVPPRRLEFEGRVNQNLADNTVGTAREPDRAVRVIRLKPEDNNVIAAGLENGTIQLWDVLGNIAQRNLFSANDRVFDLDFTPDSRYLFSGHGSGQIRQWDLTSSGQKPVRRIILTPTSMSIAALGVYQPEPNTSLVAIAGQYNKLLLWDWVGGTVYDVAYPLKTDALSAFSPIQGQFHYIESVAIAQNVLVTADNQGLITIWDLANRKCQLSMVQPNSQAKNPQMIQRTPKNSQGNNPQANDELTSRLAWGQCQIPVLDQWGDGHDEKAVRAIAITPDGAYLASGGDDGRVKLWFLNNGKRRDNWQQGKVLASLSSRVHSVDIKVSRVAGYIFVTSDAPEHQVKLYREPLSNAN